MKKSSRLFLFTLLMLCIFGLVAMFFAPGMVVLNPKGWVGIQQRDLFIIATLLMLIVVVPVFILTIFIVWKYRAGNKKNSSYSPDWGHSTLAEVVWWGIPFIIIIVLSFVNWKGCLDLDPFKPLAHPKKELRIQVVALDWKWLFIYPDQQIATVNFIQFPVDTPIHFEISGDAPMNSFWIPELGGQIFAMAGMKTELYLIAGEKGDYRGVSANLSGKGFSGMTFTARASSEKEFNAWIKSTKGKAKSSLNQKTYKQLAKPSENNPVTFYSLGDRNLFDWIVTKDMTPPVRRKKG